MTTIPDKNMLIAVYGGKCDGCGRRIPEDNGSVDPDVLEMTREDIRAEWNQPGRGDWLQSGYPKKYPAWMVREGFRCPWCLAPQLLLALTPPQGEPKP